MRKLVLMAALLCGVATAQTTTAQAQKWEYGFLNDSSLALSWTTPTERELTFDRSYKTLTAQMKCPTAPANKAGQEYPVYELWYCLGQQGWEYVGQGQPLGPGDNDALYIFKRPAK